jgi:hypothetical protein
MKFSTAALLVAVPSAAAFAPGKAASFRPASYLFSAPAATETKVRPYSSARVFCDIFSSAQDPVLSEAVD